MSQKRQNDQDLSQQEKKSKLSSAIEGPSFQPQEVNMENVIMPWDDNTEIIFSEPDAQGETITKAITRWELIKMQLNENKPIYDIQMFIDVIRSYNVGYNKDGKQVKPPWKCMILRHYFNSISDEERDAFFRENGILSSIRHLALNLRGMLSDLTLLKSGTRMSHTLHQLEIASLLANAFMCTFPKRKANCPSINFNSLFEGGGGNHVADFYVEKLKCIIHYFRRITEQQPVGKVTFKRLCIPDNKLPRWDKTDAKLCDLQVDTEGKIEEKEGYLQMDFANRYVGGGVLGRGCVQEEIRFIICPELIVARLFTECLADNEALLITGAERYCDYLGYSDTFEYNGNHVDKTPFDDTLHRKTYLIVLDALYFQNPYEQYRESKILRELKKAYVGFQPNKVEKSPLPIATGNWGCGAFRGDPQLKSMIQLMAASQAGRNLLYLTFGDAELKTKMEDLYEFLRGCRMNVGDLYCILRKYRFRNDKKQTVYEYIKDEIINPRPQSSQIPSSSTFKPSKPSFVKKEPSKKLESNTLFEDEFAAAEKSSTKIKNDIAKTKKSIEKHFEELEMDYDISEKRIKRHSSNPKPDFILEEEDKKLLELYYPLPEKKEHVSEDSVWFENEITSHTSKKVEKRCGQEPSDNSNSMALSSALDSCEKMSIDNSIEEEINQKVFSLQDTSEKSSENLFRSPSPSLITSSLEQHYKDAPFSKEIPVSEKTSESISASLPDVFDDSLEINSSYESTLLNKSEKNCEGEELVVKKPVEPQSCSVRTEQVKTDKKYSQIKITEFFSKKYK